MSKIKVIGKSKDVIIPVHVLDVAKGEKAKGPAVKAYKLKDNRQVTHNLRRRMGR